MATITLKPKDVEVKLNLNLRIDKRQLTPEQVKEKQNDSRNTR